MENLYLVSEGLVTLLASPSTGKEKLNAILDQIETDAANNDAWQHNHVVVIASNDKDALKIAENDSEADNHFYPDSYGVLFVAKKA